MHYISLVGLCTGVILYEKYVSIISRLMSSKGRCSLPGKGSHRSETMFSRKQTLRCLYTGCSLGNALSTPAEGRDGSRSGQTEKLSQRAGLTAALADPPPIALGLNGLSELAWIGPKWPDLCTPAYIPSLGHLRKAWPSDRWPSATEAILRDSWRLLASCCPGMGTGRHTVHLQWRRLRRLSCSLQAYLH